MGDLSDSESKNAIGQSISRLADSVFNRGSV